jgi:hypothetical protein
MLCTQYTETHSKFQHLPKVKEVSMKTWLKYSHHQNVPEKSKNGDYSIFIDFFNNIMTSIYIVRQQVGKNIPRSYVNETIEKPPLLGIGPLNTHP